MYLTLNLHRDEDFIYIFATKTKSYYEILRKYEDEKQNQENQKLKRKYIYISRQGRYVDGYRLLLKYPFKQTFISYLRKNNLNVKDIEKVVINEIRKQKKMKLKVAFVTAFI